MVDWPLPGGWRGRRPAGRLADIGAEVSEAIRAGARIIVLSDRGGGAVDPSLAPIPSLLLTGAVHHHLIREGTRTLAGLVVESADARESHHIALLIGYGAAAVNPYLALESVRNMVQCSALGNIPPSRATANLSDALGKGLLKIMSKMGVSTVASYTGAQIFEAVGLGPEVIDTCFTGTASRLGGAGFDVLADEVARRHARAFDPGRTPLPTSGWRLAVSTSGGVTASRICSTPKRYSNSSTLRELAGMRSSRSTPAWWTTSLAS